MGRYTGPLIALRQCVLDSSRGRLNSGLVRGTVCAPRMPSPLPRLFISHGEMDKETHERCGVFSSWYVRRVLVVVDEQAP
jgi:hypothetical protein